MTVEKNQKTLRWGILSTANIGIQALIPGIRRSCNGRLDAICSRDLAKAETAAKDCNIPRAYGSYQELLDDPEIDAVYNPLPNTMHAEWTIKAARAGKHVLCEKPLAANAVEAQAMVDACREAGVVFMEAFMYRFHPQHERILRVIREGVIGKIRHIEAAFSFVFPDIQNFRLEPGMAGGSLMDVGCYAINVCRLMTGDEPLEVTGKVWINPKNECEYQTSATLLFPNDVLATIHSAYCVPDRQVYCVYGDKGSVGTKRAYAPQVDVDVPIEIHTERCHERILVEGCHQYQLEVEAFGEAVLLGKPLRWSGDDGVKNMQVIDAIYLSACEGRSVGLDEIAC